MHARKWYKRIKKIFKKFGLKVCPLDPCLFVSDSLIVILYVDDILILSLDQKAADEFESFVAKEFKTNVTSEVSKYVGHEVKIDEKGLILHCEGYIQALLTRFNMNEAKIQSNPGLKGALIYNEEGETVEDKTKFLMFLGCLNFISNLCRPDIQFSVNFLARASAQPQKHHMKLAVRIFKYLKGTKQLGIAYKPMKDKFSVTLQGFTDSDWASDNKTRKSVSGYLITINDAPLIWKTRKQPVVSQSTFEAELISMCSLVEEVLLCIEVFKFLKIQVELPVKINCDNQSALKAFKKDTLTKRSRYIDVRFHKVKNKLKKKLIKRRSLLQKTTLQMSLPNFDVFQKHRDTMMTSRT